MEAIILCLDLFVRERITWNNRFTKREMGNIMSFEGTWRAEKMVYEIHSAHSDIYVRTDRKINMYNISELTHAVHERSPRLHLDSIRYHSSSNSTVDTYTLKFRMRNHKLDRVSKDFLSFSRTYILNYLIDSNDTAQVDICAGLVDKRERPSIYKPCY